MKNVGTINESTTMSVALVTGVLTALMSAVWWASSVSHRLNDIENAVVIGVEDRWTGEHMRAWVSAFQDSVEVWSLQLESTLPEGAKVFRFQVPDPERIRGTR